MRRKRVKVPQLAHIHITLEALDPAISLERCPVYGVAFVRKQTQRSVPVHCYESYNSRNLDEQERNVRYLDKMTARKLLIYKDGTSVSITANVTSSLVYASTSRFANI